MIPIPTEDILLISPLILSDELFQNSEITPTKMLVKIYFRI
jgi:hypothetical protein